MRRSKAYKLSCRYDLGFLPESRKMLLITCNQVIGTRGIGAFDKYIVITVSAYFKAAGGRHDMAVILTSVAIAGESLCGWPTLGRESTSAYAFKMGRDT
jgi:hypothetical protein